MTVRTDDNRAITDDNGAYTGGRTRLRDTGDQVDVAPGVPMDRVRWGPIMAGVFAALTSLAVLTTLGAAIGLSAYDPGDRAEYFAVGGGVWGVVSMVLAFGFGGYLAARSSAVRGRDNGLLNGFMVAGVGLPILLLALGSAGVVMGSAEIANDRDGANSQVDGEPQLASGVIGSNNAQDASRYNAAQSEEARDGARRTAWMTLVGLALAIGAASMAGLMGAREDREIIRDRRARTD